MRTFAVGWWLSCAVIGSGALGSVTIRKVELVGGVAKAHRWMTLRVVLKNHGTVEMAGRLVTHGEAVEPGRYSRSVSLPPGSRFRVQLRLHALRSGTLEVAFQRGGEIAAYHQVSLALVPDDRRLVLVVDRATRRLPFLVPRNPDDSPRVKVAMGHAPPSAIPNHWIGYDAFDVVALHDVVASAMSGRQRDALLAWVRSGGTVVACVGRFAAQYRDEFFGQLLGVRVLDSVDARASIVARAVPADGAGELTEPTPLTIERRVDCGRGVFVALDASAADEMMKASWQDRWYRLFAKPDTQIDWRCVEREMPALLEEFSGYRSPSLRLVWLAMAGFFLAAVPVNYVVFRKLRRLEWAWLAMVALAVASALAAHATGLSSRGLAAERSAMTVLRTHEHARVGRATTFVALFSVTAADLEVGMSDGSAAVVGLEEPGAGGPLQTEPSTWHVEQSTEMELRLPNVRPASFNWCRFEHLVRLPEPFAVKPSVAAGNESRILHGAGPWEPARFAVVEGAKCFHGSPRSSGHCLLEGPVPVERSGVYHQLSPRLITMAMGDRAPQGQHRVLSHMYLFEASLRLSLGSIVGCSTKQTTVFSDGRPADPAMCWILVDRASAAMQWARGLPVQLRLRTERTLGPYAGIQGRGLTGAGGVGVKLWPDGTCCWRGRAEIPAGLPREWWHRLRLKFKLMEQARGSFRVLTTVFANGKPKTKHLGLLAGGNGGGDLIVEILAEKLPVSANSALSLEVLLNEPGRPSSRSRAGQLELRAFLEARVPQ